MRVLGLDPGGEGALVVIEGEEAGLARAIAAASWRMQGDRWRFDWSGGGSAHRRVAFARTLPGAIAGIARWLLEPLGAVPDASCYEAAFLFKNPQAAISIAASRGAILATLECCLWLGRSPPVREVQNGSWWKLCGLPPGAREREERKEQSLRCVPGLVPGLAELLAQVSGGDHVTDAAACALVGLRHGAERGTASEWEARLALASGRTARSARAPRPRAAGEPKTGRARSARKVSP
jgi:hypothetical protein